MPAAAHFFLMKRQGIRGKGPENRAGGVGLAEYMRPWGNDAPDGSIQAPTSRAACVFHSLTPAKKKGRPGDFE